MPSGFERLIKKVEENSPKIGEGSEKVVFEHYTKPDRVIGIYKEDAQDNIWSDGNEERKTTFYLNKIMNLLYPQNFPPTHLVSSEPRAMERGRVMGTPLVKSDRLSDEFKNLISSFAESGIAVDPDINNFLRDRDGNIVYVDDFAGYDQNYDPKKLRLAIESKLEGEDKVRALKYLERATYF